MDEKDNGPKSGQILTEWLHFDDRERMREWLKALRDATEDALAAGEDATRRFSQRVLSRAEARRKLHEAEDKIEGLLTLAESALETK
jgi:hypothetical protein